MEDLIKQMTQSLSEEQFSLFLNIMWIIWKARNEVVFQGKNEDPKSMLVQAQALTNTQIQARRVPKKTAPVPHPNMLPGVQCLLYCDGSWDQTERGGIGSAVYCKEGIIQHVCCQRVTASSPFHAEVLALKEAILLAQNMACLWKMAFCTDALELERFCSTADEKHSTDWKAISTLSSRRCIHENLHNELTCWQIMRGRRECNSEVFHHNNRGRRCSSASRYIHFPFLFSFLFSFHKF